MAAGPPHADGHSHHERPPPSCAAAYQRALDLCRRGELTRAEAACREIMRAHSGPDVLLLLGIVQLQGGRAAQAAVSFARSLQADPEQFMARALLGDALLDSGRPREALESYESAVQLSPDLVPAHFDRANALLDAGQHDAALSGFEAALRLKPAFAQALRSRGDALFCLRPPESAAACYAQLLKADPASEYAPGALLHAQQCCADWSVNVVATAGDALWAGLPVLTCAGESFAARMAGSILRAAGLSELITHTPADYELQVLRLAQRPQLLNDLRRRLGEARRRAPVFDTERCVRSLESAYVQMWQRHEQGGRPCTLAVPRRP